jgi:hypothetical protein
MPVYLEQVTALVRATRLYPPTGYTWFGRRAPTLPTRIRRVLTHQLARSYLLHQLQAQFYRDFYCTGGAIPPRDTVAPRASAAAKQFAARLQQANIGSGYWDSGWRIRQPADDTGLLVEGKGLLLQIPATMCAPDPAPAAPEEAVQLRFPKEFLAIAPGFYTAAGDTPLLAENPTSLVRLYWNVDAEGAVKLMALVTRSLNETGVPFRLKVLTNPSSFTRCDAAVLYVRHADYEQVAGYLGRIYEQMRPHLRAGTPALTKPLAPGLGLAEDPEAGSSFGQHRCGLLAEGLVEAHAAGARALLARVDVVRACFAAAGISLAQPYLNPGSQDVYQFRLRQRPGSNRTAREQRDQAPSIDTSSYLATAIAIAQHLIREAISFDDQCNWIGPALPERADQHGLVYRALGPDLYGGTGGIGLFLAEVGAVTQDEAVRRLARAALRRALACAQTIPPGSRLGLYTGWVGLAYAAVRGGVVLQDESLIIQARQVLDDLRRERARPTHDFLAGRAGAIVGLLILGAVLADPSLHHWATDLGAELITAATRHASGYSWSHPSHKRRPHLTGLSHGAAGIGLALLELAVVTGEARFRAAGEQAFAYEQAWFDPKASNWPDFREGSATHTPERGATYASYWCHGAAGIALTRLRAYALLGTATYRETARIALATTRSILRATLDHDRSDFCLCHGLAGNADILQYGRQVLGPDQRVDLALVDEVAHIGIARCLPGDRQWPCGIEGAEAPGLMIGRAGIGLFYLRLHNPQTPSVLLPHSTPSRQSESTSLLTQTEQAEAEISPLDGS